MPLLHKKQFQLKPPPEDLLLNEEVFVCPETKEIFRDYESFFSRHLLCKKLVWSCELTGLSNLTYTQAVDSEKEAQRQLDSLACCYQKAALSLIHHTRRTNLKTLSEEIISFYKQRFIEGETVDHVLVKNGSRDVTSVRVVKVIQPPPSVAEPVSNPPNSDPVIPVTHTPISNGVNGETNGSTTPPDKPVDPTSEPAVSESVKSVPKSPKTPRTPLVPLSSEISLNPADYRYVVRKVNNYDVTFEVSGSQLARPKSQFTTAKLKVLLKMVLYRKTEKHPFAVKEEYVEKFNLGVSSVDFSLPTPSNSSRKRSLSQSQISSFFSPGDSSSAVKKPRSLPLKTPKNSAKKRASVSSRKNSKSGKKTKSPTKTPRIKGAHSGKILKLAKTPSGSKEALKLLHKAKAKKLKQLDLKSSLVNKDMKPLTLEELNMLRKRLEEEKQRKKEERLKKLREKMEQKKREKLRQEAWLKPREDTLCEDSVALPSPAKVKTDLPPSLFPETVMLLEFLNTFGPLFNIREVITGNVTFEKIEFALITHEIDSLLFDVLKFLLQALFATMEEEHEGKVNTKMATTRRSRSSSTLHDTTEPDSGPRPSGGSDQEPTPRDGRDSRSKSHEESSELVEDDVMEVEKEEIKSLDTRVQKIKASAAKSALWSFSTQRVKLKDLTLDPYTCTEVLRLHLLSSGGYSDTEGQKKFRMFRRGGYSDSDDPAVDLRLRRPEVVESLEETSIYALPAKDKIEIISTLCLQLLTYVDARELMDENMVRMKSIRRKIRAIGFNEERRKREEKSAQFKEKKAAKQKKDSANAEVEKSEDLCEKEPAPPTPPEDKETEEERKERIARELAELHQELSEATACVYLRPIGSDRNYSKYWLFPNLPGLYVEMKTECDASELADRNDNATVAVSEGNDLNTNSTALVNGSVGPPVVALDLSPPKTPPQTPPTDVPTTTTQANGVQNSNWYCFNSIEDLDVLLASLNPRGLRELALKQAIQSRRGHLENTIHKCPFKANRTSPLSKALINNADQYLELYLREQILDIEDKIVVGNLGYLKLEGSRVEWRDVIENSGAAAILGSQSEGERPSQPPQYTSTDHVAELSKALLQVHEGIDAKFLMPPLGTAVDIKKKTAKSKKEEVVKEGDLCPEQWKQALSTVTSFSQIFVHLATLERAVMWSRSLLNVRCRICRRKCGDEFLLLCDGCDNGYHTYCLKPPLKTIPEGDWYCNYCAPVTPVKQRRGKKVVVIEESSESESEEEEAVLESDPAEESSELEEEDDDEVGQRMTRSRVASVLASRVRKRPAQSRNQVKRGRKPKALSRKIVMSRKNKKVLPAEPPKETAGARKKLKLKQEPVLSKAESLMASIVELKCSRGSKALGSASRREQKSLEMQLCEALWGEMLDQEESTYFEAPVKKKEYPTYHEVISTPMDLHTVKLNIKNGKYDSLNDFAEDVQLIFSNCIKFHKRHSQIGKAGVVLRDMFERRCSELGLSDLGLMTETKKGPSSNKQRSSRRK